MVQVDHCIPAGGGNPQLRRRAIRVIVVFMSNHLDSIFRMVSSAAQNAGAVLKQQLAGHVGHQDVAALQNRDVREYRRVG